MHGINLVAQVNLQEDSLSFEGQVVYALPANREQCSMSLFASDLTKVAVTMSISRPLRVHANAQNTIEQEEARCRGA
eukprot:4870773-Amphidinium_carterae.1